MKRLTTEDRIIEATIALVNEKGYKGATTKAIAEKAKVNEVTLFRHFGSKRGIVEAAIKKHSFSDTLLEAFDEQVIWDLKQDLKMIVREQQRLLEEKRHLILISLKEAGEFPELDKMIAHAPLSYRKKLTDYFTIMIEKKKMRAIDAETVALNFLYLNTGFFMFKSRLNTTEEEISIDYFINNNLMFFIESLL